MKKNEFKLTFCLTGSVDIFLYRSFKTKHTFNDTKLQDTPRLHVLCRLPSLPSEEDVDLFFYPILVVGGIGVGGLLVYQAREIGQLQTYSHFYVTRKPNQSMINYLINKIE